MGYLDRLDEMGERAFWVLVLVALAALVLGLLTRILGAD